jgi:hypothetical protein
MDVRGKNFIRPAQAAPSSRSRRDVGLEATAGWSTTSCLLPCTPIYHDKSLLVRY